MNYIRKFEAVKTNAEIFTEWNLLDYFQEIKDDGAHLSIWDYDQNKNGLSMVALLISKEIVQSDNLNGYKQMSEAESHLIKSTMSSQKICSKMEDVQLFDSEVLIHDNKPSVDVMKRSISIILRFRKST